MKKIITIIILLCAVNTISGQTKSTLEGRVICSSNDEPVIMATVAVKELNIWTATTDDGEFVIRNLPSGTFTLVVTCIGFIPKEQTVSLHGKLEMITVKMDEATLAIDEIVVTAKRGQPPALFSVIIGYTLYLSY